MKKRAKQQTMPEMDTPLSEACDKFIEQKTDIAEAKIELLTTTELILVEMKKAGKKTLRIQHGGEEWLFEALRKDEELRVVKKTKTPAEGATAELELVDRSER